MSQAPPPACSSRVETRLEQIIAQVVDEAAGQVIEFEVMADHVHLLVEVPPTMPLSTLVESLKGRSWRMLRGAFPALRRGPPSWFVSTVGGAPLEVVRRYVENQKTAA